MLLVIHVSNIVEGDLRMPFEILSIDVTGPHPKSSNDNIYILTAMDQFSKFAFAYPMKNQEAATIARILID